MNNNSLIAAALFTPASLQFPNAWIGHLPFASWMIQELLPAIVVELGTHSGNSYFSFCQAVVESQLSTKCYAVDTWQGDEHAGKYGDEVFTQVNAYNQAHFTEFSHLLRMTFDDAIKSFTDGSIDLLHIDGCHTYEAVKHDFETWLPKLAPGAVVLFHDTAVRERGFGVWKLWEELRAQYPLNMEFEHSYGLGVLQLATGSAEKQLTWLVSDAVEQQILKNFFATLGSRQIERYEMIERIDGLNQAVFERDERIDGLNQAVVERDGQIAGLNQIVAERDEQVAVLNKSLTEMKEQVTKLYGEVKDRDELLARLFSSRSWKMTAPLRLMRHYVRRLLRVSIFRSHGT